jgi:hypothetical protein
MLFTKQSTLESLNQSINCLLQQLQEQHEVRVLLLQGSQAVPVSAELLSQTAAPTDTPRQSLFAEFAEAFGRVPTNLAKFRFIQLARLGQNAIIDFDFTDVVQQTTGSNFR